MSSRLATAQRYWHTLRYLRPRQVIARLRFRFARPHFNGALAQCSRRTPQGPWERPAERQQSMMGPVRFRYLNCEAELPSSGGWNDSQHEKLWLYNLHYFDDLNASDAGARAAWHRDILQRWVAENPGPLGNGWEPYPSSLRIVNWIKWSLSGHALPTACADSLVLQARWLSRRLEFHLLGNHLFANAKALVFAGLYFDSAEAAGWLQTGLQIIARELPEQVLSDGGNFERSPMYHAIFFEDMLDLLNARRAWPEMIAPQTVDDWTETAVRMAAWLEGLTHPDGEIALFNDAAFGIAPTPLALGQYAARLGLQVATPAREAGLECWADSGYIRMSGAGATALLDVAPIGPDYLPGHAHADTLSFELSIGNQRLIVNGGTSCYGLSATRLRERETAAHSTVEVAGQSSSEVWSGFRVARRAYPRDLRTGDAAGALEVSCAHDGYARLRGRPVHRRDWRMEGGRLIVSDTVSGKHRSLARYIFHPSVVPEPVGHAVWRCVFPNQRTVLLTVLVGHGRLAPASYAPEFGKSLDTRCLEVELAEGAAALAICWDQST